MGGETLFKQLGIDLFAVRHAAKLEATNALSKKELLQQGLGQGIEGAKHKLKFADSLTSMFRSSRKWLIAQVVKLRWTNSGMWTKS